MSDQPVPQAEALLQQHSPAKGIPPKVRVAPSALCTASQSSALLTLETPTNLPSTPTRRSARKSNGSSSQTLVETDGAKGSTSNPNRTKSNGRQATFRLQLPQQHVPLPRLEQSSGTPGKRQAAQGHPRSQRRMLRVREAAEYLGVSPWKIRELINSGQLPYVQNGLKGHFSLDIRDLDAYIEFRKRLG